MSQKRIIVIVGPTGIGKTDLSIKLAQHLKTEIISFDSRQFFKELKIGTAPPCEDQLKLIQHHFIHNLSINDEYNAGLYEKDVMKKINELHKKYDNIILVGGSGLYIKAIVEGIDYIPNIPKKIRTAIQKKYEEKGLQWLQNKVKKIDSKFYSNCDTKNPRRLIRALEVYTHSKVQLSSFHKKRKKDRSFKTLKIGLKTSREFLYKKLEIRVDNMIKNGLVKEVISLSKYQNKNALKTVGYKEIFDFQKNKYTLEEAINKIKINSKRYAKRQITWFNSDKSINWFYIDEIEKIKNFIEL